MVTGIHIAAAWPRCSLWFVWQTRGATRNPIVITSGSPRPSKERRENRNSLSLPCHRYLCPCASPISFSFRSPSFRLIFFNDMHFYACDCVWVVGRNTSKVRFTECSGSTDTTCIDYCLFLTFLTADRCLCNCANNCNRRRLIALSRARCKIHVHYQGEVEGIYELAP